MKFVAYVCLAGFAAAASISLFTLIETSFLLSRTGSMIRWNPDVGDAIAAVLTVGAVLAAVAIVLTKFVGFGVGVIRHEKRGFVAGVRALPVALFVVAVLSLAYGIAVYAMVQTNMVKRIGLGGAVDEPMGYYLFPNGDPRGVATRLDKSQFRTEKAAWTRKITALSMNVYLLAGCFLLSRYRRRDPELVRLAEEGISTGQIDDPMQL